MKLKSHIRRALVLSLCALGSVWVGHATAQDYPSKPITMVMPYAAGGPGDTITRLFAGLKILYDRVGQAGFSGNGFVRPPLVLRIGDAGLNQNGKFIESLVDRGSEP